VTVFRLDDRVDVTPGPGTETFHALGVICQSELDEGNGSKLIDLLWEVATEQEAMLKQPGIPGGPPACQGFGTGIRFSKSDGARDAFACFRCSWMWGADNGSRSHPFMIYVFSEKQLSRLQTIVDAALVCRGPGKAGS
jgi:hypothetical protein